MIVKVQFPRENFWIFARAGISCKNDYCCFLWRLE